MQWVQQTAKYMNTALVGCPQIEGFEMGFEVPHEGGITLEDGDWKVMTIVTHTLATDT